MRFVQTDHYCYDEAQKEYRIEEIKQDRVVISPVNMLKCEIHLNVETFRLKYWIPEHKIMLINEKRSSK